MVMTGHSLGGGLAKIHGAKYNISAVTFSSPGIFYTGRKYGITPEMHRYTTTIQPDMDVVPTIDRQAGTIYRLRCALGLITCHTLLNTVCALYRTCGDSIRPALKTLCK